LAMPCPIKPTPTNPIFFAMMTPTERLQLYADAGQTPGFAAPSGIGFGISKLEYLFYFVNR
jgi:hypothetical protein